jgi:predicted Fe-Mo cluster-binding NifX family protein
LQYLNAPGGLEAGRSGHFGHCDVFTVIEISPDNAVVMIENSGHEAGGCMAPASLLKDAGVEAIVVAGLGRRPMLGFNEAGISVYYADQDNVPDVKSVFENLVANKLVVMHPEQVCKGSGDYHH